MSQIRSKDDIIIPTDSRTCKLLADRVPNKQSTVSVVASFGDGFVEGSSVKVRRITQIEYQRRRRLSAQAHEIAIFRHCMVLLNF